MSLCVSNSSLPHTGTPRTLNTWKMPNFSLKKVFGVLVSGQILLNHRVPVFFMPNSTIKPSTKGIKTAEQQLMRLLMSINVILCISIVRVSFSEMEEGFYKLS